MGRYAQRKSEEKYEKEKAGCCLIFWTKVCGYENH
jgi:hypothetical protein